MFTQFSLTMNFSRMAFHCKIKEQITFSVSAFTLRSIMKGQVKKFNLFSKN